MKIENFYTGFTLIELLIVLSIMGVLATLGFQSFTASQKKARDAQRKSDLNQIQEALELYKMDQKPSWEYPADSDWIADLEDGGYMKEVPADPLPDSWSWPAYSYNRSSDDLEYDLYACLENENDPDLDPENLCSEEKGFSYTITEP